MASLSNISIKRPVLAIVMSLVIILFGIIGFTFLGIREFPSVDPPVITVQTSYIGANADVIEAQITEPLEEAINGIAGIRTITSVSREGRSNITVEFDLGVDLEAAANDVRNKVSGALNRLPQDVDPPVIEKADADSSPIIFLTVRSDKRDPLELSRIAEILFKERIQTIPGVSSVQLWGQKRYSMRLWMDPIKLASFKLAPSDVLQAVNRENVELPSGRVEGQNTELTVRTMGRLNTVDDFNNLIIKEDGNQIVRFQDIGYAQLYPENDRTILRRDGVPGVAVAIVAQPGANNIDISERLYKKLDQIKRDLPEDVTYQMSFDSTQYIRASILEVEETIIIAFCLVLSIIFIFLRDWRTTIIPVVTIPISLIGAFFVMYILGFSINVLTLLGIVLAIGLVVDDAIVVLENIYVKIEEGEDPEEAAKKGSTEIYFAVISSHLGFCFANAHTHDERKAAQTKRRTQLAIQKNRTLLRSTNKRVCQLLASVYENTVDGLCYSYSFRNFNLLVRNKLTIRAGTDGRQKRIPLASPSSRRSHVRLYGWLRARTHQLYRARSSRKSRHGKCYRTRLW